MISTWLKQPTPCFSSTDSNNLSSELSVLSTSNSQETQKNNTQAAVTVRLEAYQNTYLLEPKEVESSNCNAKKLKAQTQWKTLNNAIEIAATIYSA